MQNSHLASKQAAALPEAARLILSQRLLPAQNSKLLTLDENDDPSHNRQISQSSSTASTSSAALISKNKDPEERQRFYNVQLDRTSPTKWALYLDYVAKMQPPKSAEELRQLYARAVKAMVHVDRDGNDAQLIRIWLDFISVQRQCGAALEVCVRCFQQMRQLGIGTRSPDFFSKWADYVNEFCLNQSKHHHHHQQNGSGSHHHDVVRNTVQMLVDALAGSDASGGQEQEKWERVRRKVKQLSSRVQNIGSVGSVGSVGGVGSLQNSVKDESVGVGGLQNSVKEGGVGVGSLQNSVKDGSVGVGSLQNTENDGGVKKQSSVDPNVSTPAASSILARSNSVGSSSGKSASRQPKRLGILGKAKRLPMAGMSSSSQQESEDAARRELPTLPEETEVTVTQRPLHQQQTTSVTMQTMASDSTASTATTHSQRSTSLHSQSSGSGNSSMMSVHSHVSAGAGDDTAIFNGGTPAGMDRLKMSLLSSASSTSSSSMGFGMPTDLGANVLGFAVDTPSVSSFAQQDEKKSMAPTARMVSQMKISPPSSVVRPPVKSLLPPAPPETPMAGNSDAFQRQHDSAISQYQHAQHHDQLTAVHLQTPLQRAQQQQQQQRAPGSVLQQAPQSATQPRQNSLNVPPMHQAYHHHQIQAAMTPAPVSQQAQPPSNSMPDSLFSNRKNMVYVNGNCYLRLELIGKGGSSKVFKVLAQDGKLYALKRVQLRGADPATVSSYLNEMELLMRLKNSEWIIQLYDSEVNDEDGYIHMVMECGEIDLAGVLHKQNRSEQNVNFNFIRIHWEQMLRAVDAIHEERVVHSDLKPANFLFVRGILKLIDFGIAKAIQNDTTNIHREQQIGTVNYMSPEAIIDTNNSARDGSGTHQQCMKLGRASDVWSLGCILYQMVYGKPPFSHLNMIQKLQAIINPQHQIQFPKVANPFLMEVMQSCLQRDPKKRMTIPQLLQHPFLKIDQFIHEIQRCSIFNESLMESVVKRILEEHQRKPDADTRQLTKNLLLHLQNEFTKQ